MQRAPTAYCWASTASPACFTICPDRLRGRIFALGFALIALLAARTRVDAPPGERHAWTRPGVLRIASISDPDILSQIVGNFQSDFDLAFVTLLFDRFFDVASDDLHGFRPAHGVTALSDSAMHKDANAGPRFIE